MDEYNSMYQWGRKIGTNYDTVEPISSMLCWKKQQKIRSSVSQPHVLSTYNNYIGSVNNHDWLMSKYALSIGGKKWYWPLFTWLLDIAVVNACITYKINDDKNCLIKSLINFKRYICTTYLKGFLKINSASTSSKLINDIGRDFRANIISKWDKQRCCQNKSCCSSESLTYYQNGNVTFCVNCVAFYHLYTGCEGYLRTCQFRFIANSNHL